MNLYHQLLTSLILMAPPVFGQVCSPGAVRSGYAPVNGLKMYYEVHSCEKLTSGVPLILLHGGLLSSDSFAGMMPTLSADREVIAVDLQAHGRTADIARPFSCSAMADDLARLLKYLQIEKADVMGYSLGGGVALRTAIQYPESVRTLVLVSTTFRRDGWYPEIQEAMSKPLPAEQMKQSPLYQTYARIAPRPQDWEVFLNKLQQMLAKDYDWTDEVKTLKVPTFLIFGDADAIRPEHEVEFFQLLGGGKKDAGWDGAGMSNARLAILPGATHYNIIQSALLPSVAVQFLDASMPAAK